jgi:mannose/fructose/N-acetylgalactosamine-specific phosphotransferase system component IIB
MEKTVKINWEGQPAEIVLGEITWKQKTDAIKKSIKEVQKGRQLKKEADIILQKELMMIAAIKTAPFDVTLENIGKMNSKDGEKLFAAYSELNDLDEEEGEE